MVSTRVAKQDHDPRQHPSIITKPHHTLTVRLVPAPVGVAERLSGLGGADPQELPGVVDVLQAGPEEKALLPVLLPQQPADERLLIPATPRRNQEHTVRHRETKRGRNR